MNNKTLGELRDGIMAKGFASGKSAYVASAKGAMVTDIEGKEYIDFGGGIAVMNIGHSNPEVVKAITEQAEKFTHTCFMVMPYEQAVILGEKLCKITPVPAPKRVFLTNSGAEAVENAVKIARYYTKKQAIIVLDHGFHGRTLMTMTMTAKVKPYKWGFGPFAPEVYRIPNPYCYRCMFGKTYPDCGVACADYLNEFFGRVTPDSIAAIVVEPVQGEGGFITPPPEYFPRVARICKENGILFIADEIQSGMARTGNRMFAIEHWGVQPDIITVAKSLGAGMPISAVVGKQEIMDSVHNGGIGGTYGGNPVCCAAANAVLKVYEEQDIPKKSELLGKKVRKAFDELAKKYKVIGDVRGMGPMLALELVKDRKTKQPAPEETAVVVKYAFEKGLILLSCGSYSNVIRTMMPLVITDEQFTKGINILDEAFASLSK
jgi:4-aminobutyrate aminotransferase / (S)-3-amino-2-methylpropionate transaminase / 5-aminovalerate transaminase